jgi:hypothetical protein
MGKYLRLDAALAMWIRITPGCTLPQVGFIVAACSGLGMGSEGAGTWSERSENMHGRVGAEEEWPAGPSWSSGLGSNRSFPFNQCIFQLTSEAPSSKIHNLIFLLLKILQSLHADIEIKIEQFSFLVQLPNLSRF